jgi:ElaB/YqjD/DUF883 family membrane-anchored ribosome-binding protein
MAENDLKPATGSDLETPPATTGFTPAEPLKTSGVGFTPEDATISTRPELTDGIANSDGGKTADVKQTIRDGAGKLQAQAGDKLRAYADDGKAKAGNALDQLSQLLTDAAGQVDEKLGQQYGQYARSAADQVQGFAETVKSKDVEDLLEDARHFVRASPAAAIGVAAALGFAVARLVQAGVEPVANDPTGRA